LATSIEVWFQDEMRVGQKNSLVYQWAKKGTRPRQPKDQRYENAYLFGAVCPSRDTGVAIIMPYANTAAMRKHLEEISRAVARTRHGPSRPSWLAHHAQTQGAEKPHNGITAAGLSGTQRGGEHLAILASDLSLQSGVQELH
jgi:hypothetical protein